MMRVFLALLALLGVRAAGKDLSFPDGVLLGTGVCGWEVEGAWDEDGKSESVIDYYFHKENGPNADVACDFYHKYTEDIELLEDLNMGAFRFSLAWTRILPTGRANETNEEGIEFYNDLIDRLIAKNITPVVTIYHFDHPQSLQNETGGWSNETMIDYFVDFADVVFKNFGDRVKYWFSINEPYIYCVYVFGKGIIPPATYNPGAAEYRCIHNILVAHGRAHQLYHANYSSQEGNLGIVIDSQFALPLNDSIDNSLAAHRLNAFETELVLHPLFFGRYPDYIRQYVDRESRQDGLNYSRLPSFTDEEAAVVNGSVDILGLNLYNGYYVSPGVSSGTPDPSLEMDCYVITQTSPDEAAITSPKETSVVHPWILRTVPLFIRENYGDVPMFITENGFSDYGDQGLHDTDRISYFYEYFKVLLKAINEDKLNIIGYLAWSFFDSFERGNYTVKLGIVDVDFSSSNLTRTPKDGAKYIARVFGDRNISSESPVSSSASAFLTAVNPFILLNVVLLFPASVCIFV